MVGITQDDTLIGGDGNDRLEGLGGADVLDGGAGFDFADYRRSPEGITARLDLGTGSGGDAEGDTFVNIERVIGSAFADSFFGSAANETFDGGAGNDTFNFSVNGGQDTINDFAAGAGLGDVIDISDFGSSFDTFAEVIAATSEVDGNTVIDFGGGDTLTLLNVSIASLVADDFVF